MDEFNTPEILVRITQLEERVKACLKRIDEQKALTEAVQKLALSVERLTLKQEAMDGQIKDVQKDVTEIKEKPSKRWELVITGVITALVGAGITYFLKG